MQEDRLKPDLPEGAGRVSRGGGWSSVPQGARVAFRNSGVPAYRSGDLGFRLARNINHEGEQHEKER
jgi:formylglycine-generating enzyme required for sulfatase activity